MDSIDAPRPSSPLTLSGTHDVDGYGGFRGWGEDRSQSPSGKEYDWSILSAASRTRGHGHAADAARPRIGEHPKGQKGHF